MLPFWTNVTVVGIRAPSPVYPNPLAWLVSPFSSLILLGLHILENITRGKVSSDTLSGL